MPIDWFTVVAQILNFLVLVWILRRFLYRPILRAMDARRKQVEESVLAAEREKEAAAKERAEFEQKSRDLERERDATLNAAAREAQEERTRLLQEAREEFQSLRTHWREALRRDQGALEGELATLVQREALAVAGQLMHDLADADLQERLTRQFIQKLKSLSAAEKKGLTEPFERKGGGVATVRSAFELSQELREAVGGAVHEVLGPEAKPTFETQPALGAGLELAVDGRKASWTPGSYLDSLEDSLRDLMQRHRGDDGN